MGREVELRTEHLVLRSFRAADVDDALAYRNDRTFARYLPHIPQPFTRADAERFVEQNMTEPWDTLPTFAVVLGGTVIGTVSFAIDPATQTAMLGYAIARAHWGKGIAVEAARVALRWVFSEHPLAHVWASTDPAHVASRRVLEKLGMTLDAARTAAGEVRYQIERPPPKPTPAPPVFGTPFTDFLAWVSLQPHDWLDVREALHAHRHYSPVGELHLFDRWQPRAAELLRLAEPLACIEAIAPRPVHDGFIAALALSPAPTGDVGPSVDAFVAREEARHVEKWIRRCYGDRVPAGDIMFRGMDYPAFDNGIVSSGFGLMIDRHNRHRWLWSRAVFWHK
jgi:[ribosomal protein S5]-alanine N-acetyltransferase